MEGREEIVAICHFRGVREACHDFRQDQIVLASLFLAIFDEQFAILSDRQLTYRTKQGSKIAPILQRVRNSTVCPDNLSSRV